MFNRYNSLVPRVLSLPQESILVAASHFADSRKMIEGRSSTVKVCLSTGVILSPVRRGICNPALSFWIVKNHIEGIDTFDIGVQRVQCSPG